MRHVDKFICTLDDCCKSQIPNPSGYLTDRECESFSVNLIFKYN